VGCASSEDKTDHDLYITGDISTAQLFSEYPEFKNAYQAYKPTKKEIFAAQTLLGKSLVVMFGTWCHDSEREVPRLLKLLDVAKVKVASLSLRALNYSKQDPNGLHHTYNVELTPTIILFDQGKELGRILEFPQKSIGEDLASFIIQ
jgi:thiol-disulfide isomerase/thioredoxin